MDTANNMRGAHLEQTASPSRHVSRLGLIAVSGSAYWFLSVVLLHFLRTDSNPLERQMSNYATGDYGYLMSAAFIIWGIGILALATGLFREVTPQPRVGGGLLLIAGVAALFVRVEVPPWLPA